MQQLGTAFQWLMLINALLVGGVVLLASRAARLSDRVKELERELEARQGANLPAQPRPGPLSDDKPIPLVRHRFGGIAGLFKDR